MKVEEIRGFAQTELESQLSALRGELYNLRFQQSTRQLRNPARFKQVKRDIARILTILGERSKGSVKKR